ncbi:hypothetical protein N9240_02375, partial [Akkermansiaceae bacterium]|nr:hypothetical protein [Akkermansiaceae bacterium]
EKWSQRGKGGLIGFFMELNAVADRNCLQLRSFLCHRWSGEEQQQGEEGKENRGLHDGKTLPPLCEGLMIPM